MACQAPSATRGLGRQQGGHPAHREQLQPAGVLCDRFCHELSGCAAAVDRAAPVAGFTAMPTNGVYSYWLRSSTNITLSLTNWSIVATNPFNVQGNFSNVLPTFAGNPAAVLPAANALTRRP